MQIFKTIFLTTLSIFLWSASLHAETISYHLSMPEPHTHYFEVEMHVKDLSKAETILKLPVWTPGSYMIREYAQNIENVFAYGPEKELKVTKLNKSTWQVNTKGVKHLIVKYRVYAFEISVRHSFLDDTHAFINGTTVFLYMEGKKQVPIALHITPPSLFKQISTGLEPKESSNPWVLKAKNYDELVDCPIEIGNHEIIEFTAMGIKHEIAMYGEGNYDAELLKKDLKKIVETTTQVIGENPNKRYVFIVHNLAKGGGGLEHMNSTTLQVSRWNYQPESAYMGFLELAAHEYFHLWNVKRLRPKTLIEYNYDEENYTDLLWVFEGFTSYYDELILVRSEYHSVEKYLSKFASKMNYVENQPGNRIQSLSLSSFDAWIKLYRSNENSFNTEVSYYSKGALAAAMLDILIIDASNGEKNLDDLMRFLYFNYYKKANVGIGVAEIKFALKSIVGSDMADFIQNYIEDTEPLPYKQVFEKVGLDAVLQTKIEDIELGSRLNQNGSSLVVLSVKRETMAHIGGLNVNDEILAINGYRADKNLMEKVLATSKIGDTIELLISRNSLVKTLNLTVKEGTSVQWVLLPIEDLSETQLRNKAKWLSLK